MRENELDWSLFISELAKYEGIVFRSTKHGVIVSWEKDPNQEEE